MKHIPSIIFFAKLVLCALIFFRILIFPAAAGGKKNEPIPSSLAGRWEVSEVHVNMESGRTMHYGWNSPSLRWRIFNFNAKKISSDTSEDVVACNNPTATLRRLRVDDLIKLSFGGYGINSGDSPIKDYRLGLANNLKADVIVIHCKSGVWNGSIATPHLSPDGGPPGSWLFLLSKKRMVMRWYDQTILVLSKLPSNAKPSPSFHCDKTKLNAELAICHSFELSGLDKSIAFGYQLLVEQERRISGATTEIRQQQRSWLEERNACDKNEACILATMRERLEWLRSKVP